MTIASFQPFIFIHSSFVPYISSFVVNYIKSEYGIYISRNGRWVFKKGPHIFFVFFQFPIRSIYLLLLLNVFYCQHVYQLIDQISYVLLLVNDYSYAIRCRSLYLMCILIIFHIGMFDLIDLVFYWLTVLIFFLIYPSLLRVNMMCITTEKADFQIVDTLGVFLIFLVET